MKVTLSSYSTEERDAVRMHCVLTDGAAYTRPTRYLHHHLAVAVDLARRGGCPVTRWDGDRPELGEVELTVAEAASLEEENL